MLEIIILIIRIESRFIDNFLKLKMIYLVYDIQYYNRYLYVERDKSNRTLNSIYRKNFYMMNKLFFNSSF